MKRIIKFLVLTMILVFTLAFVMPSQEADAAQFSYQSNRDGFELTNDNKLKVTFTVSYMEPGLSSGLIKWGVYFIDPATGLKYNATTHKYEDGNNRQRDVADYYFLISPSNAYNQNGQQVTANSAGTFTIYVNPTEIAYYATYSNPSSSTDYGTKTDKTMSQVLEEKDWIIGVGPVFSNWWASGYGAPIDYYVGRQSELIVATVDFRKQDGTLINEKKYKSATEAVNTSDVASSYESAAGFKYWYCDADNNTYNHLSDISAKNVGSFERRTINFYAVYQRGNGKYIEFTPSIEYTKNYDSDNDGNNDAIVLDPKTDHNKVVTVTYKITHNDGVNSLLLLPEFDDSVFTVSDIAIANTALGEATITNNGWQKILLESKDFYNSLNETFLTITYTISAPAVGEYEFGLKLVPYENNNVSQAFYWLDGDKGEQEEVEVRCVKVAPVKIVAIQDAHIEIGHSDSQGSSKWYNFEYKGAAYEIKQIAQDANYSLNPTSVEYKYDGTAETVIHWYDKVDNGYVKRESAPIYAGTYYVGISAPAHGLYREVATQYREVRINLKPVTITVEDKSSVYNDDIVELTKTVSGLIGDDNLDEINLSTTATSSSNAGTYPITATYNEEKAAGKYAVTVKDGVYTITKKAVTIKALDQSAQYSGAEPVVDQTKYTKSVEAFNTEIIITKEAGVNVGTYTLIPSLKVENPNYTVAYENGTFTITSLNKDLSYFTPFFTGKTVTYNGDDQDLLTVANNLPDWFSYTSINRSQKNAKKYKINVTITLSEQDAANYTGGVKELVFTVDSEILKYAIEIKAEDKTREYGLAPLDLTPATAGFNKEIEVTFTVKDGNNTPITLTSTTNVGTYSIVPNATNPNYTYTFVNGTYEVTKTNPVISVDVNNVLYNRELTYDISVTVANVAINNYTLYVDDNLALNALLNAGEHKLYVNVPAGANYNSGLAYDTFTVEKVYLAAANIQYNHSTATWAAVTSDKGNDTVEGKALVNGTTLSYTMNETLLGERSYTATSTTPLTLTIAATNNDNYLPTQVTLNPVYEVTFTTIEGNFGAATGMPEAQYQFKGQTAEQPASNPAMTGYTFGGWDHTFDSQIVANTEIPAIWNIIQFEVKVIYPLSATAEKVEIRSIDYGTVLHASVADLCLEGSPCSPYDLGGYRYTFAEKWDCVVTGTETVIGSELTATQTVTILGNYTFTTIYTHAAIPFTLTYMLSLDGGAYEFYSQPVDIQFGKEITYATLSSKVWFSTDAWYTNEARTLSAPETMPAYNLTVYGAYNFNVGTGDVNGDGHVDANDITLYRQWIVGGYEMTVLSNNEELLSASAAETAKHSNTRYFITRVADNNSDASKDIRDVSITRMALVGGYTWDIENGYNVKGQEVIRNVNNMVLANIKTAVETGKKATLTADYTNVDDDFTIVSNSKNVNIDLGGHTLTVKSFSITSNGRVTITVKNGTIVAANGITISAPQGNVVLTDLTGYVGGNKVNLAAASNSLHFNGQVKFFAETDTTVENPTPAPVNVEKDTHVVIEQAAEVVVEKLVVTVNNFEAPAPQEEVSISLDNFSSQTDKIVVQCNDKINYFISTYEELLAAGQAGGSYTLTNNISFSGGKNKRVCVLENMTLDLNGFKVESTDEIPFVANNGATLTIEGNGNVKGVESCVMAFNGSSIVINGGTYTCTDNFVIGTNGSNGVGNNTIIINGGTFNGNIKTNGYIACGVYVANNDHVEINGGTFNIHNGVGVVARSGNTTVNKDVVFNITSDNTIKAGKVGDSNINIEEPKYLVLDLLANYPGGRPELTNSSEYNVNALVNTLEDLNEQKALVEEVTLYGDFPYQDQLVISKDLILHLNGHKLESTNDVAIAVVNKAKLVINGEGDVVAQEACVMAFDGSKFEINGGTYTAKDNFVVGTNGTEGRGNNTITINGGTFNGNIQSSGYVACGIYAANNDTITVNGGTFIITNGVGILARSGNTTVNKDVVFNVTGDGHLGKVGDSQVTVPAGEVLVADYAANYPGGTPTLTNNSIYGVYALVDDEASLNAAEEFANTIVLAKDITLEKQFDVTRTLTLDLNGHNISNPVDLWNEPNHSWSLISVQAGKLTINGNGNIIGKANDCYAADVRNGAELVINGGKFGGNISAIYVYGGTLTVNGGYFYIQQLNGGNNPYAYVLNCYDSAYKASEAVINVQGGQFENFNPENCLAEGANTKFLAEGHSVTPEEVDNKTIYTVNQNKNN